jgi:hypothetical protein
VTGTGSFRDTRHREANEKKTKGTRKRKKKAS